MFALFQFECSAETTCRWGLWHPMEHVGGAFLHVVLDRHRGIDTGHRAALPECAYHHDRAVCRHRDPVAERLVAIGVARLEIGLLVVGASIVDERVGGPGVSAVVVAL